MSQAYGKVTSMAKSVYFLLSYLGYSDSLSNYFSIITNGFTAIVSRLVFISHEQFTWIFLFPPFE